MPGIFDRLNFPATLSTETVEYSEKTLYTMNAMPKLLNDWQYEDIASSSTTGYFKNPTSPIIANLTIVLTSIETVSKNVENILTISNSANVTLNIIPAFVEHTDRLSGMVEVNENTAYLPHYESAIGVGKVLAHLVYQSDGVANNAALIGSFGGILSNNTLQSYYTTLGTYPQIIVDSIFTVGPNTFSSLPNTTISMMSNNIMNLRSFLINTRVSDENFFTNSRAVVDDYNAVKGFTKMGQTEKELTINLIGSDKLLSRIT